jgi:hypothetical protein
MSEDYVNQITLSYLMNKEQYKNHLENSKMKIATRKDKKFYRKRILNLTKDFLLFKENDTNILSDVNCAFENYVKTCIEYFKILDKTDILQEEYDDLEKLDELIKNDELDIKYIQTTEEANNILMRSNKMKTPSLDPFVKRIITKNKNEEIIPIQKDINLKEPYLKNKGICKKKNISNNYEKDKINEEKK